MDHSQQELPFDRVPSLLRRPVNVATVPQRSPFRYPGGKTWFVPVAREWLRARGTGAHILIEPFAGGGIISLTALFEGFVPKVLMVELDDDVASVWQAIVDGDAGRLAHMVLRFTLTPESLRAALEREPQSNLERAFQTLLKNRTFHGGILAEGSAPLRYGENGRGILSRWYPRTLANRLLDLASIANRIEFRHADGLQVIEEYAEDPHAIFFIDPPYTAGGKKAGKRLYRHSEIDHQRLFTLCETLKGDFLMTYDYAPEVVSLAKEHRFDMRVVPMKNTHHARMEELVISRSLDWLGAAPVGR